MENVKRYLTGSTLFFNSLEEFKPHDLDYCELIDEQDELVKHIEYDKGDIFRYRKESPDVYVQYALNEAQPWTLCQYLTPGFCKEVNFTIEHLKELKSLRDNLPERQYYQKVIYDAFIENNDFLLTKEQLLKAFEEYKKYRQKEFYTDSIIKYKLN